MSPELAFLEVLEIQVIGTYRVPHLVDLDTMPGGTRPTMLHLLIIALILVVLVGVVDGADLLCGAILRTVQTIRKIWEELKNFKF